MQHEHSTFANILLLCFDTTFFSVVCGSLGRLNTRAKLHTLYRILFSLKRFATYQIYKTWPSGLKMPLFFYRYECCMFVHAWINSPLKCVRCCTGQKKSWKEGKEDMWCRDICRLYYIVHQTKYRNKLYYTGSYVSHWTCYITYICIFSALIICNSWTTTIDHLKEVETIIYLWKHKKKQLACVKWIGSPDGYFFAGLLNQISTFWTCAIWFLTFSLAC